MAGGSVAMQVESKSGRSAYSQHPLWGTQVSSSLVPNHLAFMYELAEAGAIKTSVSPSRDCLQ